MLAFPGSRRAWLELSTALLLLAISCGGGTCGGGGASCATSCAETPYVFPRGDSTRPDAMLQSEAVRARINQRFLDFIKPQIPALIRSQLVAQTGITVDADDVIHVPIPDGQLFDIGVASANLRGAEALLWLQDIQDNVEVRFESPSAVHITLSGLRLGVNARLREDVAGTTSSCPIGGRLGPFGPGPLSHAAQVSIDMTVDPGVGADPARALDIQVDVASVGLDDLSLQVGDYCSELECQDCATAVVFGTCLDPGGRCTECHVFCGGVTNGLLSLSGALVDLIRPILNQVMRPVVQNVIGSTLNGLNGSTAKIEQQIALKDIIPVGSMRAANPIGVFVAPEPGRFPVVDRGTGLGMEITTTVGAEGPLADCVGEIEDFVPITGPVPDLAGADPQGRPYHVGVTVASSLLNQFMYAAHRSGSLCLRITSEEVRDLTNGRFTLNASLLTLLAADIAKLADDTAPVILELKPRHAPTVSLGSGRPTGIDEMGNPVSDWLIKVGAADMGLAFHVFIQDRYVRVFEVTTDILAGFNVTVLPDNRLELAVGELKIDDFTETFNEILPNADFAMVLPTLIEIAMQALLQDTLTFPIDLRSVLSDALGGVPIFLRLSDPFRDGVQQDFLTLTLTFTSSAADTALSLAAETQVRLDEKDELILREDGRARPTGRVRLRVSDGPAPSGVEGLLYQARVDGGLWRTALAPRPDGTILIEDAHLLAPGRHEVEVRARFADDYTTLDATPVALRAVVDIAAPQISASTDGSLVVARVFDRETSPDEPLQLEARLEGAEWADVALVPLEGDPATRIAHIPAGDALGKRLELRATDARGNQSQVAALRVGATALESEAAEGGGCACHDLGGTPHRHDEATLSLVAVAALGAFLLLRRLGRI